MIITVDSKRRSLSNAHWLQAVHVAMHMSQLDVGDEHCRPPSGSLAAAHYVVTYDLLAQQPNVTIASHWAALLDLFTTCHASPNIKETLGSCANHVIELGWGGFCNKGPDYFSSIAPVTPATP